MKKVIRCGTRFSLFLVLIVLSACQSSGKVKISLGGEPLSGDARRLVEEGAYRAASSVRSFRFMSETALKGKKIDDKFRQAFIFERPDRMRVEFLATQAFYAVALLAAEKGKFVFLDVEQKEATQAELTPKSIKKFLGVYASYDQMFSVLSARLPLEVFSAASKLDSDHFDVYKSASGYVIAARDKTYVAELNSQSFLVERLLVRDKFNDSALFSAEYAEPINAVDGASGSSAIMFQKIKLFLEKEEVEASIQARSISINPKIREELFTPTIPSDFSVSSTF